MVITNRVVALHFITQVISLNDVVGRDLDGYLIRLWYIQFCAKSWVERKTAEFNPEFDNEK